MKLYYALLVGIFSISLLIPAFGHGTGIESSPFVNVNDRDVRVTVEHLTLDDNESNAKFFQIHAYDRINNEIIENTNFDIKLFNDDQVLTDDSFFEEDGILVLGVATTETGIFTFNIIINAQAQFGAITD